MPDVIRRMRCPAIVVIFTGLAPSIEIPENIPCLASQIREHRIELREPDHLHFDQDRAMLDYAFLDLHSPVITGAQIPGDRQEFVIVGSSMPHTPESRAWWAATAAGRQIASRQFARYIESRAAVRLKQMHNSPGRARLQKIVSDKKRCS